MSFRIFIGLFLLVSTHANAAGVWESISQGSYQLFHGTCANSLTSSKTNLIKSPDCEKRNQLSSSLSDLKPISQNAYLGALAAERAAMDQCALNYVKGLQDNPQAFEVFRADFQDKLEMLSAEIVGNLRLSKRAFEAKNQKEELKKIQQEIKKNTARIAAIENSIPLSDHAEIRKLISEQVQSLTKDASTLKSLHSNAPPAIASTDSQALKNKLKSTLGKVSRQLTGDIRELGKGADSLGQSLDRVTRESLAQDRDLVERFMRQNPELAQSSAVTACEVDALYGKGAEIRDQTLFMGSLVATGASMGAGLAARSAIGAVALTTPTRVAAARGLLALRSSRILGAAAIGLDGVSALKEVSQCNQHQSQIQARTKTGSENRCVDFQIENIEASNCYLAASLAALGVASSSEKARNLVAKFFKQGTFQSRAAIEKVVGRINDQQEVAIQRAHLSGSGQIGRDGKPASVGNYTWEQLRDKAEILRSAGFSPSETRKLMESGIVGLEPAERKGFLSRFFSGRDEVVSKAPVSMDPKKQIQAILKSADSPNKATKDFREAYLNEKFEGINQFISYKPGGVGERILVRADYVEVDGQLRAVDVEGNVLKLNADELQTARMSSSPEAIRQFQGEEEMRIAKALGGEPKDPATAEFRDRWARGNFHSSTAGTDSNPSIISYLGPNGARLPGRVEEILDDGRLRVRTMGGGQALLGPQEMASARMASPVSARSFMDHEAEFVRVSKPALTQQQSIENYQKNIDQIAPKIDFSGKSKGQYLSNGYWRQWMDPTANASVPDQGWKLHVGATAQSAEKIAESVIPELQKRGIMHKVVDNLTKYSGLNPSRDTQAGKFMTIYPRNDREAREIANLVDGVMKKQGLRDSDFIKPPGELVIRPGVSARFGRFTDGPLKDSNGREIHGSTNMIRLPGGQLVPDERGVAAPRGVADPFR